MINDLNSAFSFDNQTRNEDACGAKRAQQPTFSRRPSTPKYTTTARAHTQAKFLCVSALASYNMAGRVAALRCVAFRAFAPTDAWLSGAWCQQRVLVWAWPRRRPPATSARNSGGTRRTRARAHTHTRGTHRINYSMQINAAGRWGLSAPDESALDGKPNGRACVRACVLTQP